MNFTFLQSLPAILAVVVLVIYWMIKKSMFKDPIISSVLDKLRVEAPEHYRHFQHLTTKQKEQALRSDAKLREKLTDRDRSILEKALNQQFKTNIFIYSLCAILILTAIILFIWKTPKDLHIDNITIQNADSISSNLLVDIDPILVTWTSIGEDGELKAVLENVQTGTQTTALRVQASEGKVRFDRDSYTNFDKILYRERTPNGTTRIRAILYAGQEAFKSKEFEIRAGVSIIAFAEKPDRIVFNAILDQTIIDNFHFAPSLALFEQNGFEKPKIFEADGYSAQPYIRIVNATMYNAHQMVFNVNPRDIVNSKIYRTDIQSLREAVTELKKLQKE